jgi:hypothetical protein
MEEENEFVFVEVYQCLTPADIYSVVWGVGLVRLNIETVGSNPVLGMDVCPRFLSSFTSLVTVSQTLYSLVTVKAP